MGACFRTWNLNEKHASHHHLVGQAAWEGISAVTVRGHMTK
jgi:hypothetical protein